MNCQPFAMNKILGKKWNILILLTIQGEKNCTFNRIKKVIKPITSKILAQRLKELKQAKIVEKNDKYKEDNITYTITTKGKELLEFFNEIKKLAVKHNCVQKTCLETNCVDCISNKGDNNKDNSSLLTINKGATI